MIGYPCDRKMNVLGMVTNRSIAGITISNDKRTEELEYGSTVLSLDITYDNSYRSKAKDLFKVGNYLLVHFSDKDDYYTIIDREDDYKNNSINLYCENCGLDLLNEIAGEYKADKEYNIAHYVNTYIYDTGFEIKINELGDSIKKQLSLSSGETLTSRILSIAKEFEAEIDYTFEIDKLSVVHKYINIYKKRGNEDQNVELRLNREIDNIICTESISELVTAFSMVIGSTPEGQNDPIDLVNYDYDDGDIYVEKSSGWVFSRKGLEEWSRYLSETGTDVGHIVGTFSYDTTDRKTLCDKAVEELKKKAKPKTEYDIELSYLPDNVKVGDTVLVSDEDGNTYFTARLTKIESSDTEKEVTVTFGDFEAKEQTISQQLKDLADQFNKVVQQRPLYTWFAYADDVEGNGISLEPGDKKYLGVAYNKVEEEVDISDPSIFTWSLIQGDTGNGIDNIVNYYLVSTQSSGITPDTSGWTTETQTTTNIDKYLWSYSKILYTNGDETNTSPCVIGTYGDKGDKGDAAIKSDTPPEDTDALWFDTTSDLLKYYNGTEWVVANDYANDLNDMKQEITKDYSTSFDKLNDSISSLVTELQTVKTDNETSVNQLSSQILQNSDSISLVTNEINNVVDNISGMATKEEISQWARFQNGIIELGASNSPFAVKISATELGFYQNGIRIAYLSNQQLNISQAVVMKQIDLQPFQIITDSTLGLIIK